MADEKTKNTPEPKASEPKASASAKAPVEPGVETSPVAETVALPTVAAPENALIGDENQPSAEPFEVGVVKGAVPAQTTGPAPVVVDTVQVHETYVQTDKVVTDPHSPEAVQIPDAGRGSLDLPIHGLSRERPEDYFAREASKADDE